MREAVRNRMSDMRSLRSPFRQSFAPWKASLSTLETYQRYRGVPQDRDASAAVYAGGQRAVDGLFVALRADR